MKIIIILAILIVAAGCRDTQKDDRIVILQGHREAPLGWVALEMYEDSTFQFTSAGWMDKAVYKGRFEIWDGLISLIYEDSISSYLGNYIHISGSTIVGEKGMFVTDISINKLDSLYGDNSYFDCEGLDRDVAANLLFLERFNEIPSYASGPDGTPSKHMKATKHFKKLLSKEDALILYNHPNSFIKTLAFKKLWHSRNQTVYRKLIDSFTDSAIVYEVAGCQLYSSKIAEYYLNVIEYPSEKFESNPTLTSNQKIIIDSLAEEHNYKERPEKHY